MLQRHGALAWWLWQRIRQQAGFIRKRVERESHAGTAKFSWHTSSICHEIKLYPQSKSGIAGSSLFFYPNLNIPESESIAVVVTAIGGLATLLRRRKPRRDAR
jgi:cyanate permease